jgi:hypothetical protein
MDDQSSSTGATWLDFLNCGCIFGAISLFLLALIAATNFIVDNVFHVEEGIEASVCGVVVMALLIALLFGAGTALNRIIDWRNTRRGAK